MDTKSNTSHMSAISSQTKQLAEFLEQRNPVVLILLLNPSKTKVCHYIQQHWAYPHPQDHCYRPYDIHCAICPALRNLTEVIWQSSPTLNSGFSDDILMVGHKGATMGSGSKREPTQWAQRQFTNQLACASMSGHLTPPVYLGHKSSPERHGSRLPATGGEIFIQPFQASKESVENATTTHP